MKRPAYAPTTASSNPSSNRYRTHCPSRNAIGKRKTSTRVLPRQPREAKPFTRQHVHIEHAPDGRMIRPREAKLLRGLPRRQPRVAKPFTRMNRTTATCIAGMQSKTTSRIRIHFFPRPREANPFTRVRPRETESFTRFTRRFLAFGLGIFAKRLRWRPECNPS